jgi:basic amino acid/polyamine antiporter, APA family
MFAIVIALSGRYEQILNYVVSVDFIWFGLTAASLFIFRRRAQGPEGARGVSSPESITTSEAEALSVAVDNSKENYFRVPGHPVTTILFVVACTLIVLSTVYKYPENSGIGLMIVVTGIPVYFFWRWWRQR